MGKIYLGVCYGYDGWSLTEYGSVQDAIGVVHNGGTYGSKWKLLREIDIEVKEIPDTPAEAEGKEEKV